MIKNISPRILLSGATILAAAALAIGATFAFFSDTETSTDNTFVAGALDLKVDAEAHYAGLVCRDIVDDPNLGTVWIDDPADPDPVTRPDLLGDACGGTWDERDLTSEKFFDLTDIKPGDDGENTISLHVINNDAWGRLVIENDDDLDVDCTEPETESADPECITNTPGEGELQDNMLFQIWLDEGLTNGFQCSDGVEAARCTDDPTEGDNILQETEPILVTPGTLDVGGETLPIWLGLATWAGNACAGDGSSTSDCPGLTSDGHMVGSITYYFGLGWELPDTTGNEAQSDSLVADLRIDVQQHSNKPFPLSP